MAITLVLPPLSQLNTPYPSISYLAEFLRQQGLDCVQRDLGLELVLRLFSPSGLSELFDELEQADELPEPAWRVLSMRGQHLRVIEPVVAFLQGTDRGLAAQILDTPMLPVGPRLQRAELSGFGPLGVQDAARYLATLYLEDLADLITSCIDPGFSLVRYQAHLATGAQSFEPLWERLRETSLVDRHLDELCDTVTGDVIGISVPFPGNLYGALRVGRRLKARGATVLLGGGYVNTELRDVQEPRLWSLVDALMYDGGEQPLLSYLQFLDGQADTRHRTRTATGLHQAEIPQAAPTFGPYYGELPLGRYLHLIDTLNPAHRLWADGRWNKITIAHGCYWRRCTFCDVSLDYIQRYESSSAQELADHIERLVAETGQRGFHFVDEAAPPRALKALAIELLARNTSVTLWGNIRFEKAYTPDLCRLLAAAGVVAVTGGLEVADERLLTAIDKGVTVPQVARAAAAFQSAGIMVHAYLMYGFPTETEQETLNSMELVRQLFVARLINSAYWHRFVLTRHAPIAAEPERFGIQLEAEPPGMFARNDLRHRDPAGAQHDRFDEVLPLALEAWLQGRELDRPVHSWFEQSMPATTHRPDTIARALKGEQGRPGRRLLWLGGEPLDGDGGLGLHAADGELVVPGSSDELDWLAEVINAAHPAQEPLLVRDAMAAFPGEWTQFESRWQQVRQLAMVLV